MKTSAYIGFGANLGDREQTHARVLQELNAASQVMVASYSRLYETVPQAIVDDGPTFLNGAIGIETTLLPEELIRELRRIELLLGKSPLHSSDRSRFVDLDLLLYGATVIKVDSLEVPHPRMHDRAFVLAPLAEIAPDIVHPILGRSIKELLQDLPGPQLETIMRFL